jgi:hypothetical protein
MFNSMHIICFKISFKSLKDAFLSKKYFNFWRFWCNHSCLYCRAQLIYLSRAPLCSFYDLCNNGISLRLRVLGLSLFRKVHLCSVDKWCQRATFHSSISEGDHLLHLPEPSTPKYSLLQELLTDVHSARYLGNSKAFLNNFFTYIPVCISLTRGRILERNWDKSHEVFFVAIHNHCFS